ncbi:MAG: extracellular solute-binding protein [Rhodocyclaceae bacterium]|nr:extracellular solute-binding protein [Rhodocyclaceae bacterium]
MPERLSPAAGLLRGIAASLAVWLSILGWQVAGAADGAPPLRFGVVEQEPYAGASLPRLGYAPDLIRSLFERLGLPVEFVVYPPERASSLTESGALDGWLPVHPDPALADRFELSDGFPGKRLGLLKRREMALALPASAGDSPAAALAALSGWRLGTTRATLPGEAARAVSGLTLERVATDLQNLDKLAYGRIDLVLIDPYVAADLLALNRPHLIDRLEVLRPLLFASDFHVGFARGSPAATRLKPLIDKELAAMRADGTLAAIVARHGLATDEGPEDGRVRLRIGTVNNPDMAIMQALSVHFEADHPDVTLDWRVLDEGTLRRRVLADLALQEGRFDVVTLGPNEVQTWSRAGWLRPIDGLGPDYELDDLLPTVRDSLTVNGSLYALPFYAESSMTYYRRDLMREAGVSMPSHPTIDEIEALAARLHDPERGVFGICLRGKPGWGENMAVVGTLIHTFGGRWFDMQWQPLIDSPAWRAAIDWYVRVLNAYGPPDAVRNGYKESLALFLDGRCAIWIDATVAAGQLFRSADGGKPLEVGFAAAPFAVTERGAHWLWTWALAIPRTTRHADAAMRFVTWATSKAYVDMVAADKGWVAVPPGTRQSTYRRPEYRRAAPFADFVVSALNTADVRRPATTPVPYEGIQVLNLPEFPALGHQVGTAIADALAGRVTVGQALAQAQRRVSKVLRDAGYPAR